MADLSNAKAEAVKAQICASFAWNFWSKSREMLLLCRLRYEIMTEGDPSLASLAYTRMFLLEDEAPYTFEPTSLQARM